MLQVYRGMQDEEQIESQYLLFISILRQSSLLCPGPQECDNFPNKSQLDFRSFVYTRPVGSLRVSVSIIEPKDSNCIECSP